jgi:hypothetical protein
MEIATWSPGQMGTGGALTSQAEKVGGGAACTGLSATSASTRERNRLIRRMDDVP